jgi:hypothetical protein
MPFQYQPYSSPFAGSIAQLIARRGEIAAHAAELAGQANARGAEQSGAAWANGVQNTGQILGALPLQMVAARRAQTQDQVQQLNLKAAQREDKSQTVFESALKDPANYHDDGTVNDAAITESLKKQDVGAWQHWQAISAANAKNALDLRAKSVEIVKNTVETQEKQQQFQRAQADYLGRLAFNASELLKTKPDDPLHARDTLLAAVARATADGATNEQDAKGLLMQTAQATPAQLASVFEAFVPPELRSKLEKESADTAKSKAQAELDTAKAANVRTFGRETPGSPEEQYLTAITRGDEQGALRILKTMRDTAQAKRDPAQQALAKELGALRADEARARLDSLQKKNEPLDIGPDITTTRAGRSYIDLSLYQGNERNKAREAANAAGAVGVSKEQANALQEIDNARLNQQSILDQMGDLLPKSPLGRGPAKLTVPLQALFQTDEQIAAFNTWRTAAIQTLRATAGSKGLRINQAEIAQAIENDIPRLTDTLKVAQQKVQNINTMLDNAEQSILVKDRSVKPPAKSEPPKPLTPTPSLLRVEGRK